MSALDIMGFGGPLRPCRGAKSSSEVYGKAMRKVGEKRGNHCQALRNCILRSSPKPQFLHFPDRRYIPSSSMLKPIYHICKESNQQLFPFTLVAARKDCWGCFQLIATCTSRRMRGIYPTIFSIWGGNDAHLCIVRLFWIFTGGFGFSRIILGLTTVSRVLFSSTIGLFRGARR